MSCFKMLEYIVTLPSSQGKYIIHPCHWHFIIFSPILNLHYQSVISKMPATVTMAILTLAPCVTYKQLWYLICYIAIQNSWVNVVTIAITGIFANHYANVNETSMKKNKIAVTVATPLTEFASLLVLQHIAKKYTIKGAL